MRTRNPVALGALAVLLLTAISLLAVAAARGRDKSSAPYRSGRGGMMRR